MITISFRRFDNGIYISHTDVLRSLNRSLRRAGISVNYSKGFNRHMSLKLSQPLPLGVASDDEWLSVDVAEKIDKAEFLTKIKKACPPYLEPTVVYETAKNPNLASKIIASDYEIKCEGVEKFAKEIENLVEGFTVYVDRKGENKEKNYAGYVYDIKVEKDLIKARFCFGNKNLRADIFIKYLKDNFGLDIPLSAVTRKAQLVEKGGRLVPAKEYMESIC